MDKQSEPEILSAEEITKDWEDSFYENGWEADTLTLTETEGAIIKELTTFLPRHMELYDWNLPYAEEILLIFRRLAATGLSKTKAYYESVIIPARIAEAKAELLAEIEDDAKNYLWFVDCGDTRKCPQYKNCSGFPFGESCVWWQQLKHGGK